MANVKFKNALARVPQSVPPIWFMRQAGRYHQHYQGLRAKHSFVELCKVPDLAAEVAMGPIRDFDFDCAILFSDILFPLEAMGMGLTYEPQPTLAWQLEETRINSLRSPSEAIEALQFQNHAMRSTRDVLPKDKSLIGFVGGPWTLFTYAVEGSHKGGLEQAKKKLNLFTKFCDKLVPLLISNIELQFSGGAEVVMIFDTAAGELSPGLYRDVVVGEVMKLARAFPKRLGYYAKTVQPQHFANALVRDPGLLAGIGVDHRWEISDLLPSRSHGFVQGNFDQSLLFLDDQDFSREFARYIEPLKRLSPEARAGWVSGLGHGVLPKTPEKNVKNFVRLVREVLA